MFSFQQLQNLFAFGECATFAVALAERYKLPIVEIHDPISNDFIHAVVELPVSNNNQVEYLDSYGCTTITRLKNRYSTKTFSLIESNPSEIRHVALVNKKLLPAANELILKMIESNMLPQLLKAA